MNTEELESPYVGLREKQRAVIEAAKAYIACYGDYPPGEPHELFVPLNDAVEALQELE